mmetsp:Transcript_43496/g.74000  ORF Transcript_43496/g.74000 Transcript_43496/m.74000 type:complete len:461 (-) Transcript_43496:364-1746(-)
MSNHTPDGDKPNDNGEPHGDEVKDDGSEGGKSESSDIFLEFLQDFRGWDDADFNLCRGHRQRYLDHKNLCEARSAAWQNRQRRFGDRSWVATQWLDLDDDEGPGAPADAVGSAPPDEDTSLGDGHIPLYSLYKSEARSEASTAVLACARRIVNESEAAVVGAACTESLYKSEAKAASVAWARRVVDESVAAVAGASEDKRAASRAQTTGGDDVDIDGGESFYKSEARKGAVEWARQLLEESRQLPRTRVTEENIVLAQRLLDLGVDAVFDDMKDCKSFDADYCWIDYSDGSTPWVLPWEGRSRQSQSELLCAAWEKSAKDELPAFEDLLHQLHAQLNPNMYSPPLTRAQLGPYRSPGVAPKCLFPLVVDPRLFFSHSHINFSYPPNFALWRGAIYAVSSLASDYGISQFLTAQDITRARVFLDCWNKRFGCDWPLGSYMPDCFRTTLRVLAQALGVAFLE